MWPGRDATARGALLRPLLLLMGGVLGLTDPAEPQFAAADNMNGMDHGSFISSTITLDPMSPRGIIAHKGIAVRVGPEATMVKDTSRG